MKQAVCKKRYRIANIVLAVCLFVAVNVCAVLYGSNVAFDVTEGRLYTPSEQVKTALKGIREPVTVTVYRSENLTGADAEYATYVSRLLMRYESLSNGAFRLIFKTVAPYTAVEDEALLAGLENIRHQETGGFSFFGMTMTTPSGRERVIPAVRKENYRFLEYRLAKNITDLTALEKPVVGVISMRPEFSGWPIVDRLRKSFDIRFISRNSLIIPDIDALLLVNPQQLSDNTLYAVDQYLMAGGRVLAFADRETAEGQRRTFRDFLLSWAVSLIPPARSCAGFPDKVAKTAVFDADGGPVEQSGGADNVSDDIVFDAVGNIGQPSPAQLILSSRKGIKQDILLSFPREACFENVITGVRLSGRTESAFDRTPKENAFVSKPNARLAKSRKDAVFILFSDSDMLNINDGITAGNALLVENALAFLTRKSAAEMTSPAPWRRDFSSKMTKKKDSRLRRQQKQAREEMAKVERVLQKMTYRKAELPPQQRAIMDKSIRHLEEHLVSVRKRFRKISARLEAVDRRNRQSFFALNVLFVPFILIVLISVAAIVRFCRKKGG